MSAMRGCEMRRVDTRRRVDSWGSAGRREKRSCFRMCAKRRTAGSASWGSDVVGPAELEPEELSMEERRKLVTLIDLCPGKPVALADLWSDFSRFCSELHRKSSSVDDKTSITAP